MMSSFGIYAKAVPTNIHGISFTGSCGIERSIFVPNRDISLINPITNSKENFVKVHAGHIMQGDNAARDVVMNTNALNVEENTPGTSASRLRASNPREEMEQAQLQRVLNHPPVTPVRVLTLKSLLSNYDPHLAKFLIDGFSFGFRIGFVGSAIPRIARNLRSAEEQPEVLACKIGKELSAGRVVGPFSRPPFKNFISSPLGVVPKKIPGEFRIIHHLSYPEGYSVNDFIPPEAATVQYASISDAISLAKTIGRGCFMAKTDIKSAFRIIPIHPHDYHLLGFSLNNSFYFDRTLPMGCSSSCAIFEAFSTSLEWLAKTHLCATGVLHILDDFLFLAESEAKCRLDLNNFLGLCSNLGVPIAHEKTEGPLTTLQFAGITLDTLEMEARLPEDKLEKCKTLLSDFQKRRKVTLKELQSLVGLLNFTCSVVLPGRAFLRRLIDLTKGVRKPHHRIRMNMNCRKDILVWKTFLEQFNGRTFFLEERWSHSTQFKLYTDAAGSKGYGAIFGNHWLFGAWPESWKSLNIAFLELFPIVIALHVWGPRMNNQCVSFFTDNAALVDIINKQTSKHNLIMILIRDLVLTSLRHNILFRAFHVPGVDNTRADLISRFQIIDFKKAFPEADIEPTPIPETLLPLKWSLC